jgi:tetratricopeptide (TPR) repeat protein
MIPRRLPCLVAIALLNLGTGPLHATCGGGGGGGSGGMRSGGGGPGQQVYQVPWKYFHATDAPPTEGLVLYWFPASANEVKNSSLRTSRDLSLYAGGCIAMYVADGTAPVVRKLGPNSAAPLAVLVDSKGDIVAQVGSQKGKLLAEDVEDMVEAELDRRDAVLKGQLADGKAKAKAGDRAGATQLFQAVWAERCLFPKRGKEAGKELKKLGVTIADAELDAPDNPKPIFGGPTGAKIVAAMQRGLQAELAGDYDAAARLYAEASLLDPADPTPARYLGEVYRHYTGQWDKARAVFTALLSKPADPLSRAVALHGLGKMTIHEGHFVQGLRLIEDSTREFPLALAYRNLAVFWNSECDPVKAAGYVEEALKLDPKDPYNVVFAAVFMAQNGRKDEALRIARENEALLPASYNLAAIYAQAGDPDRALAYLKRHFYTYERYQAVRSEEMMEARVDEMFASLRGDPRFLQLTAMADGMLPMKMTAH